MALSMAYILEARSSVTSSFVIVARMEIVLEPESIPPFSNSIFYYVFTDCFAIITLIGMLLGFVLKQERFHIDQLLRWPKQ